MVGVIPCRLSSELHVNGRRIFRAKDKSSERGAAGTNAGRLPKRNWVISMEG
jgi:hypothetical protein